MPRARKVQRAISVVCGGSMLALVVFLVAAAAGHSSDPCCLRVSPYHLQAMAQRMAQRFYALEYRAQDLRNVFTAFQGSHGSVIARLRFLETDHARLYSAVLRMDTRLQSLEMDKSELCGSRRCRRLAEHSSDTHPMLSSTQEPEVSEKQSQCNGTESVLHTTTPDEPEEAERDLQCNGTNLVLHLEAEGQSQNKNTDPVIHVEAEGHSQNKSTDPVLQVTIPEELEEAGRHLQYNITDPLLQLETERDSQNKSTDPVLHLEAEGHSQNGKDPVLQVIIPEELEEAGRHLKYNKADPVLQLETERDSQYNSTDPLLHLEAGRHFQYNDTDSVLRIPPIPEELEDAESGSQYNGTDSVLHLEAEGHSQYNSTDPLFHVPSPQKSSDSVPSTYGGSPSLLSIPLPPAVFNDTSAETRYNDGTHYNLTLIPFTNFTYFDDWNVSIAASVDLQGNMSTEYGFDSVRSNCSQSSNNSTDACNSATEKEPVVDLSDAELQEALRDLSRLLESSRDASDQDDAEKTLLKKALALALDALERTSDACLQFVNATTDALEGLL